MGRTDSTSEEKGWKLPVLQKATHKDALPRIDDTLNTLAGSKWSSTLYLLSGYWQVEVAESDRPKTPFCTTEELFEFKVMAPATLMSAVGPVPRVCDCDGEKL